MELIAERLYPAREPQPLERIVDRPKLDLIGFDTRQLITVGAQGHAAGPTHQT